MGYDDAKQAVTNDWTWSVGNTPHSITTSGAHFSAFHIDQIRRQQALVMVEHMLDTFNEGVRRYSFSFLFCSFLFITFHSFSFVIFLVFHSIKPQSLPSLRLSIPVDQGNLAFVLTQREAKRDAVDMLMELQATVTTVTTAMGLLDFETALEQCEKMLPAVQEFAANATKIAARATQTTCDYRAGEYSAASATADHDLSYLMMLIIGNSMVLTALVLTQSKGKRRVKVD